MRYGARPLVQHGAGGLHQRAFRRERWTTEAPASVRLSIAHGWRRSPAARPPRAGSASGRPRGAGPRRRRDTETQPSREEDGESLSPSKALDASAEAIRRFSLRRRRTSTILIAGLRTAVERVRTSRRSLETLAARVRRCAGRRPCFRARERRAPRSGSTPARVGDAVDPCVDFYAYACGGWKARNPLPSDRARYSRFEELDERNILVVRDILEKAAVVAHEPQPARAADRRLLRRVHGRGARGRGAGSPPSPPTWPRSSKMKSVRGLPALLAARADQGHPRLLRLRVGAGRERLRRRSSAPSARAASACRARTTTWTTRRTRRRSAPSTSSTWRRCSTLAGRPRPRARADAADRDGVETILARGRSIARSGAIPSGSTT